MSAKSQNEKLTQNTSRGLYKPITGQTDTTLAIPGNEVCYRNEYHLWTLKLEDVSKVTRKLDITAVARTRGSPWTVMEQL